MSWRRRKIRSGGLRFEIESRPRGTARSGWRWAMPCAGREAKFSGVYEMPGRELIVRLTSGRCDDPAEILAAATAAAEKARRQ